MVIVLMGFCTLTYFLTSSIHSAAAPFTHAYNIAILPTISTLSAAAPLTHGYSIFEL